MDTEETLIVDDDYTTADWYKDLVQEHANNIPEDAITVEQFAKDTGLGKDTARSVLKDKVQSDDSFHSKKVIINGCRMWVFWHKGDD